MQLKLTRAMGKMSARWLANERRAAVSTGGGGAQRGARSDVWTWTDHFGPSPLLIKYSSRTCRMNALELLSEQRAAVTYRCARMLLTARAESSLVPSSR